MTYAQQCKARERLVACALRLARERTEAAEEDLERAALKLAHAKGWRLP